MLHLPIPLYDFWETVPLGMQHSIGDCHVELT